MSFWGNIANFFGGAANNVGRVVDNVIPGNQSYLHPQQQPQQPQPRPVQQQPQRQAPRPAPQPRINLAAFAHVLNQMPNIRMPITQQINQATGFNNTPVQMPAPVQRQPIQVPQVNIPLETATQFGLGVLDSADQIGKTSRQIGKDVLRAAPRAIASFGLGATGQKQSDPSTYNATNKFLLGKDYVVKNPEQNYRDLVNVAPGQYGTKTPTAAAVPLGIGLTALDLIPGFGSLKKGVAEQFVKAGTKQAAKEVAIKNGIQLTEKGAVQLAKTTKTSEIKAILNTESKPLVKPPIPKGAIPIKPNVPEASQPIVGTPLAAKPIGEQIGRLKAAIAKEPDPNTKMELASQLQQLNREFAASKPRMVPKALDSNGTQLLLSAPKTTAEKVAARGAVSPKQAKQIFKRTGIAPEVLQKNRTSQIPMTATAEGIAVRTPRTANRAALKEAAHKLNVYGLGGKDRSAFGLARETPQRIQNDVFGKNANVVNDFLTNPIRQNESNRLAFVNDTMTQFEQKFKAAGITRGSEADKLGFRYGEGHISKEDVLKASPKHGQAIIEAADAQRKFYDTTIDQINASLRHYGYPEIPKRQNYLTHTQAMGSVFERLGNLLNGDKSKLPTEMSGINMDTKPGKSWFQFAQQRKGGSHDESLVRSLEAYLPGASNQIHHTDSVQRARALQNALTDPKLKVAHDTPVGTLVHSSDRGNIGVVKSIDGADAQVHFINKAKGTEQTVTLPIESLSLAKNEGQGNTLSNYNSWLSEYANTLAGKKISVDRPFEKIFGRQILEIGGYLKRKTGANMIGGNISSALTNFIPLTQALATTSKKAMAKATLEATRQPFSPTPGLIDGMQSQFIKNRFAKTDLNLGKMDKAGQAAGWLFKTVDRFTSETIVRGKYNELVSKGISKQSALKSADDFARKTMADRSIGETPTLFNSKVLGAATQFQLEVNNQISVLLKDIPQNAKSRAQLASQLSQVVIYSYLANNVYQQVTGRRPAIDPIEYALNLKANVDEAMAKDDTKGKAKGLVNAGVKLASDAAGALPFTSTVLGGGRIPMTSGLPDPTQVINHPVRELSKPITNYVLPFGGGQISKTVTGIDAFMKGKVADAAGKTQFDIPQTPANLAKLAAFGKWSTPEAQSYLANHGMGSPGTTAKTVADNPDATPESTGFIATLNTYAKAIGTDPATAFDRIMSGQKIRRTDSGAIIVERMTQEESAAVKKALGGKKDVKLDHTIPLQLGGSNAKDNLAIVPTGKWASYTPVENYLGKLLRDGTINKDKAQSLIKDFKSGNKTADQVFATDRSVKPSSISTAPVDEVIDPQVAKDAAKRVQTVKDSLPSGISKASSSTLTSYASFDTEGKAKFNADPKNKLALHTAQYEQNKLSGTLTAAKDFSTQQSLIKEAITSKYSQAVLDFYSLSNKQKQAYIANDPTGGKALLAQSHALDSELTGKTGATTKFTSTGGIKIAKAKSTKAKVAKKVKAPKIAFKQIHLSKAPTIKFAKANKAKKFKIASSGKQAKAVKLLA